MKDRPFSSSVCWASVGVNVVERFSISESVVSVSKLGVL